MENNHRQGRTGAGVRALRRAHARRLLLTLADICRQLRLREESGVIRAAYQEIEQGLRAWRAAGGEPEAAKSLARRKR